MNQKNKVFTEVLGLTLEALKQSQGNIDSVDVETASFFSRLPPVSRQPPIQKILSSITKKIAPQQNLKATPVKAAPIRLIEAHTSKTEEPTQQLSSPPSKRLEKLLPRGSSSHVTDTSSVRSQVVTGASLSSVILYQDPPKRLGPQRWAAFSLLTEAQPPTSQQLFVQSVIKAVEERLCVHLDHLSCVDSHFALKLPIACSDCDVVLIFIEAHLERSLLAMLESIPSFSRSSKALDPPFVVMGTIEGKTIRTVIIHPSTPDDQNVKTQLWRALKALSTLSSPY